METVAVGSGRLAYERAGAGGDPAVLVHGGWDDHRTWERVVPGLAVALQVLVYDRRGHGASEGPVSTRPVRNDAVDLAGLLESTGLYPAHVVGHGYGGAVALRLAVERPELVRSVTVHEVPFVGLLDEPPGDREARSVSAALERIREVAPRDPETAAREYLARFGGPSERWSAIDAATRAIYLRNAGAWAREMGDPEALRPALADLRAIAVPVLATSGGASPPFAARIHDRLAAELPNGRTVRLSEGGHLVHRTDPDLWVGVLGTFLLERDVPTT